MNQASQPFGHRNVVPLIKTSAIVLGLIAIGYVAVTAAEHASPHSKAATDLALKSPEMAPEPATALSGPQLSTDVSPASNSRDDERGRIDGSRECRPDTGIVTECVFN